MEAVLIRAAMAMDVPVDEPAAVPKAAPAPKATKAMKAMKGRLPKIGPLKKKAIFLFIFGRADRRV